MSNEDDLPDWHELHDRYETLRNPNGSNLTTFAALGGELNPFETFIHNHQPAREAEVKEGWRKDLAAAHDFLKSYYTSTGRTETSPIRSVADLLKELNRDIPDTIEAFKAAVVANEQGGTEETMEALKMAHVCMLGACGLPNHEGDSGKLTAARAAEKEIRDELLRCVPNQRSSEATVDLVREVYAWAKRSRDSEADRVVAENETLRAALSSFVRLSDLILPEGGPATEAEHAYESRALASAMATARSLTEGGG